LFATSLDAVRVAQKQGLIDRSEEVRVMAFAIRTK